MSGFFEIVLRIVGWLSLPLLAFSVWLLVKSVKRENRLRLRALILPLVTTLLVPIVYLSILGTEPPRLLSGPLFIIGVAVGVVWANTTSLSSRGARPGALGSSSASAAPRICARS